MTPKSGSRDAKATRQCWECHRRRLVCDHTLPHCKKCQKAGKECPGYDEQKPLQWVEPGKVIYRRGRKNIPPKTYVASRTIQTVTSREDPRGCPSSTKTPPTDDVLRDGSDLRLALATWEPVNKTWWGRLAVDCEEKVHWEQAFQTAKIVEALGKMSQRSDRRQLERVVRGGLRREASEILRDAKDPLEKLKGLLMHMQAHDLPTYDYLSNETSEVVQAVNYFNVRLIPQVIAAGEMAPNPAMILVPLQILHLLPPAVHHTFVCLALNHFTLSVPSGTDSVVATNNKLKVYRHRGHAIRALNELISSDKTRCSDMAIVSILTFLSMELSNPMATDCRAHADGLQRLIDMRGGLKSLISEPQLTSSLVIYILITNLANTCSPPWNQLALNAEDSLETYISDITPVYSLIFPYTLSPPALFFDLIRINQLRKSASASLLLYIDNPAHALEAQEILARIEAFIPEDWAQPGAHYDEWLLIGTIHQSALAIYCTMSLQSLGVLPNNLEMDAMRSAHGDRLRTSLTTAFNSTRLSRFVMWPLVVAGVEAGYRSENVRRWVAQRLSEMSRDLGTSSPLRARKVLMRYWERGLPDWDECFDRAYVFII
ncbi:hypothetical protein P153DRAFT_372221 [Dothidotthia symphoricarpi CBS 119687]|uniref:Zn(2)-C6 fungal-type domain-containing protein n=1 Tax=Dothidotthia symphoricarpi CBS 119687 TaxID=1392245 RepID=A0A6A6AVK3_9PLEO|nr:uncharacterized protein P153DRAFT_372221 [Dothidotthia symphoricarpi CBS 119687]KAF2134984.1 hypothetical protein P153DRAFT_372221 [Dothidotthia symphoricarpi CBS 119687]